MSIPKTIKSLMRDGRFPATWKGSLALQVAVLVGVVAYYTWKWGSLPRFGAEFDISCGILFCDFVRHFFPTAAEVFRSGVPTPGYFYPPALAMGLTPLCLLPIKTATLLWGLFQGSLFLVLCLVPPYLVRKRPRWLAPAFTGAMALSIPLLENFKWGQVSALLVVLVLASFVPYTRQKRTAAAITLALATGIKLYPALFVVWFAIRRDWRFVGIYGIGILVMLFLLPVGLLGFDTTVAFYQTVGEQFRGADSWIIDNIGSQFFPTVTSRYLRLMELDSMTTRKTLVVLSYLAVPLLAGLLFLAHRRRVENLPAWAFCLTSCSLPFILESSWLHYFIHLPLVQFFLLNATLNLRIRPVFRILLGVLLILPSLVMSNVLFHDLVLRDSMRIYAGLGFLSHANTLLALGCVIVLVRQALEMSVPPAPLGSTSARVDGRSPTPRQGSSPPIH